MFAKFRGHAATFADEAGSILPNYVLISVLHFCFHYFFSLPNSARNVLYIHSSYCYGQLPDMWAIIFNRFSAVFGSTSLRPKDEQPVNGDDAHSPKTLYQLNSAENELSQCTLASRFFADAPTAIVYVKLYKGDELVNEILPGNLHGSSQSNAVQGKAFFHDIRIIATSLAYHLRFLAEVKDFQPGGQFSKRAIHADSDTFIIVNGPPSKIALTRGPATATDIEVFALQPIVTVTDEGRNVLSSDSYSDCGGLLTSECLLRSGSDFAQCVPRVQVSLVGSSSTIRLLERYPPLPHHTRLQHPRLLHKLNLGTYLSLSFHLQHLMMKTQVARQWMGGVWRF